MLIDIRIRDRIRIDIQTKHYMKECHTPDLGPQRGLGSGRDSNRWIINWALVATLKINID